MGPGITLRVLTDGDWHVFRTVRLEALREASYAFASRLADWQGDGDAEARWRQRLTDVPFNVIAELDGTPAGMVSATAPDATGALRMISMWVAPSARGKGVADALVRAVLEHAQEGHIDKVVLDVMEDNERARAFYRRQGFVDQGRVERKPGAPPERRMLRVESGDSASYVIAAMVRSDLERIREIDRAAFSADEQYDDDLYPQMLESGRSLVIGDKATIVGYAFVEMRPHTHVRSIAVHPDSHRRGYGRALLQAVIDGEKRTVDLLVDEANEPAVRLYRSMGFQSAEMVPIVPPKRRMMLDLTS